MRVLGCLLQVRCMSSTLAQPHPCTPLSARVWLARRQDSGLCVVGRATLPCRKGTCDVMAESAGKVWGGLSSKTLVQDGNRASLEAAANFVTDTVLAALALQNLSRHCW